MAQFLGEDREIADIDFLKTIRERLDEMDNCIRDAGYEVMKVADMLEKAGDV